MKPAAFELEISARRTTYCSLPGNWPQKAGSRLTSSRTATAPMSASAAAASAVALSSVSSEPLRTSRLK